MIKANLAIGVMNDDDLLACTRELVRNSCDMEAELLLHLAEIDERKLYAQRAYPSMHVFCVKESWRRPPAGRSASLKRWLRDFRRRLPSRIGSGGFRSVRPRACSNPLLERNRVPTRPHYRVRRCLSLANRSIARSWHPLRRTLSRCNSPRHARSATSFVRHRTSYATGLPAALWRWCSTRRSTL